MAEIVATNVVASRPPERRPTATPTARAKKERKKKKEQAGAELGQAQLRFSQLLISWQ